MPKIFLLLHSSTDQLRCNQTFVGFLSRGEGVYWQRTADREPARILRFSRYDS